MGCLLPRGRGKSKASQTNYQREALSYYRTPEHRAMRAELIRRWKPWKKSTGPRSPAGKVQSAMRGYKGGQRVLLREIAQILRKQAELLKA